MKQPRACFECGSIEGTEGQTCPSCGAIAAVAWPQREGHPNQVKPPKVNSETNLAEPPRKPKTPPHVWLYRRIGQIICFALAGLFLFGSLSAYDNKLELCVGAGVLFVVALTLRHQMLRRFYMR